LADVPQVCSAARHQRRVAKLGAGRVSFDADQMKLFTIGYEGSTQPQVIDRLKAAGVELVADVRAVASSRIAGFSKTVLGESLKAEGVDYLQLRALGTPKAGRDAARKGDVATMHAVFNARMQEPDAEAAFQQLRHVASEKRVALLCFEAEACGCHRAVLADRLAREDGVEVVNL
jgi:uncharacterized protein (DUF488 family)